MRTITLATIAAIATLLSSPAQAKGPAMTFEVHPPQPVSGHPAGLLLRTWEWKAEGPPRPDLSRPSDFFGDDPPQFPQLYLARVSDGEILPRTIRPRFARVAPAVYRARVVFPAEGAWVLGWEIPEQPDRIHLVVSVQPEHGAGNTSSQVTSARTIDRGRMVVGMVGAALAAALIMVGIGIRRGMAGVRRETS